MKQVDVETGFDNSVVLTFRGLWGSANCRLVMAAEEADTLAVAITRILKAQRAGKSDGYAVYFEKFFTEPDAREQKGPSPEYRAMLDASDPRDA